MNVERLYLVTTTLSKAIQKAKVQEVLEQIIQGINNHISQPTAGHLDQISAALDQLKSSLETSDLSRIPNTWNSIIEELKVQDLLGTSIHQQVENILRETQPLINKASKRIGAIKNRLANFVNAANELEGSLTKFSLQLEELEAGEAEMSIVFPRSLFSNELHNFIKEARVIDQLVETASEIETGQQEHAQLKQISSSDPTILLYAAPPTILFVLKCVHSILDAYEKVQKIRRLKADAEKAEIEVETLRSLERQATEAIDRAIETFVTQNVTPAKVTNEGRRNELKNQLSLLLRKIAARIDRGMQIEGAAEEVDVPADAEGGDAATQSTNTTLREIETLSEQIKYFQPEGEPILGLPSPTDEPEEAPPQTNA